MSCIYFDTEVYRETSDPGSKRLGCLKCAVVEGWLIVFSTKCIDDEVLGLCCPADSESASAASRVLLNILPHVYEVDSSCPGGAENTRVEKLWIDRYETWLNNYADNFTLYSKYHGSDRSTWVVWAYAWNITVRDFLFVLFTFLFLQHVCASRHTWPFYDQYINMRVFTPFGGLDDAK